MTVEAEEVTTAIVEREEPSIEALSRAMDYESQMVEKLRAFTQKHMQVGVHYGTIPGTDKPTLLKPGAEVMRAINGLSPRLTINERWEPTNTAQWIKWLCTHGPTHTPVGAVAPYCKACRGEKRKHADGETRGYYEVTVKCSLIRKDGSFAGEGVGSCNSWERKYLTQSVNDVKNTVLKMAKKRADVDATLSACRMSAFFTQDVEDMGSEPEEAHAEPAAVPRGVSDKAAVRASVEEPPHPADAEEAGPTFVIGPVAAISEKHGKDKSGKGWTRFGVKVGDAWYNTFSESLADQARKAKDAGEKVKIAYTVTQFGNDIVQIVEAPL